MRPNLIDRFVITKDSFFELLIPEDKDNYYYQPTENLNEFDIITVAYHNNNENFTILKDALGLIVATLYHGLLDALENKRPLPIEINKGDVSLSFSINSETCPKVRKKLNYSNLWLWSSTTGIQVWLYNKDGKIYLEVSYTYPWLFVDPEPSDVYLPLNEYEKSYKPVALYEINKTTAEKWCEQCRIIMEKIENHKED